MNSTLSILEIQRAALAWFKLMLLIAFEVSKEIEQFMIDLVFLNLYITNISILEGKILIFLVCHSERVHFIYLLWGVLFRQYLNYCLRCLSIELFLIAKFFFANDVRVFSKQYVLS